MPSVQLWGSACSQIKHGDKGEKKTLLTHHYAALLSSFDIPPQSVCYYYYFLEFLCHFSLYSVQSFSYQHCVLQAIVTLLHLGHYWNNFTQLYELSNCQYIFKYVTAPVFPSPHPLLISQISLSLSLTFLASWGRYL